MIAERTQQTQGKGGQRQAGVLRDRLDVRDHLDHDRADNIANREGKMCNNKIWSSYRKLGWDIHFISYCLTCLKFPMNASTGPVF